MRRSSPVSTVNAAARIGQLLWPAVRASKGEAGLVSFAPTNYDAVREADALVVATDWNEYRHPDFGRIRAALARPVVVDGRNLYDPAKMSALGFTYHSIGRPAACAS